MCVFDCVAVGFLYRLRYLHFISSLSAADVQMFHSYAAHSLHVRHISQPAKQAFRVDKCGYSPSFRIARSKTQRTPVINAKRLLRRLHSLHCAWESSPPSSPIHTFLQVLVLWLRYCARMMSSSPRAVMLWCFLVVCGNY